jgi:tetratricopeptide (TPR) repeat protein
MLGALGRSGDALGAYDDIATRFGEAAETDLLEQVADALFNKGAVLVAMGRSDDAVRAYDEIVARFSDAAEPELREYAAKAGVTRAAL